MRVVRSLLESRELGRIGKEFVRKIPKMYSIELRAVRSLFGEIPRYSIELRAVRSLVEEL